MLTAEADKFKKVAAWQPQFALQDIIQHAWTWTNK
jgi:UDP-glucose 4-epimerase